VKVPRKSLKTRWKAPVAASRPDLVTPTLVREVRAYSVPKKAEEASSERSSKSAKRFCGHESGGAMGEMQKKGFQIGIWEVVKKQVRENEFGRGCRGGPGQDILGHHCGEPIFSTQGVESGVGECGLAIDEKNPCSMSPLRKKGRQESGEKMSITRSKVGKAGRWTVGISVSHPAKP
jgi:hypothetical protein